MNLWFTSLEDETRAQEGMIARMLLHACNARKSLAALGLQNAVTFEICLVIRFVDPLGRFGVQGQAFGKLTRVCA